MYSVTSWLEAVAFMVFGLLYMCVAGYYLVKLTKSPAYGYQRKVLGAQLVRGFCIISIGFWWCLVDNLGTKVFATLETISFSVGLFFHFLTYWLIARKYIVVCTEMKDWYAGRIVDQHHTNKW